ncbi:helix-turn-helix transcriptional regulator [Actinoplanes sp. KI2]|uniref:helix-turn-helix transcriptional regulator n=1 Tax=Actinoplanes sp. KI2 TaxID=2983315 RepID=UPI0021D5B4E4|nr:helix-turn-helix transcriptional regulator [Actinoplanes sp. KI2]MCU7726913.1 helix-turn-helix transcriptional regulator [Actinoplanes sp. KI2]
MADGLIGRDSELSQLCRLVDPPPAASEVRALLGEPGMGKTALLAAVTEAARSAGLRVLTVAGRESERDLVFAGLHQLLRPVLARVPTLPGRQAQALLGAFGIAPEPVPPDALLTGIAVLTLLSGLAEDQPLLVVVDDVQWLDRASLDVLTFVARRLECEPLVLVLAGRAGVGDLPALVLRPLTPAAAGSLLDAQPRPPRGFAREVVLAQAAGNPLALIELTKAIANDPAAVRRWVSDPMPPQQRLGALLSARVGALPAGTRKVLLLAAVGDLPGLDAAALAPAERAGLVRVDASGVHFAHPLVRAAVCHGVPFAARAAAHRTAAAALRDRPDRHAWHLAAAALGPDERVAALLEQSADRAQRRGGAAAAARALERAAALSPIETDQARRLLAAAALAQSAGQADRVRDLAERVLAATGDPAMTRAARERIGWAQVRSGQHAPALETLLSAGSPAALGFAATVAHQSGTPADRTAVLLALDRMPGLSPALRQWVRACAESFAGRLPFTRAGGDPVIAGSAAWLLEESEEAVRLLREALDRLRAPGTRGRSGGALSALHWACFDAGRWDEALAIAREAQDIASAYRLAPVGASAGLLVATVSAMRGEYSLVHDLLAGAMTDEYRSSAARARHTSGMVALAQGNAAAAYAHLRHLFADGEALHHRVSYLGIADLAAAAERIGQRRLVERALATVPADCGPRLRQIVGRAHGLLGEPASFEAALADPAGEQWPLERAQLRLDHGEWLRRQRRINDAKPVLTAALETFRRLRARPLAGRAEAELRACGVPTPVAPKGDALAELTAQQREIVVLAGRGLTNAEIADRLFLSPRTVASHLHRSYPKLGVAGRRQLRDLI